MVRLKYFFLSGLIALGAFVQSSSAQAQVQNSTNLTAVRGGGDFSCALFSGDVYCWGYNGNNTNVYNGYGQLGDGTNTFRSSPGKVVGIPSGIQFLTTGDTQACAATQAEVYCWGSAYSGERGNNSTDFNAMPTKVVGLPAAGISDIEAGGYYTCAVISGDVYCWGSGYGLTPVKIQGIPFAVKQLATGWSHNCVTDNIDVYCWGTNDNGQLGDGTTVSSNVPVQVAGLPQGGQVRALSAGYKTTCVVSNGDAYCWGNNGYGQLGDGTTTSQVAPQKVQGLANGLLSVSAGDSFTCAYMTSSAYCWGYNGYGNLGDGTTTDSLTPKIVTGFPSGSVISDVRATQWNWGLHACALADGDAYCWGYTGDGIVNTQDVSPRYYPVVPLLISGGNALGVSTMPSRPTFSGKTAPGSQVSVTVHSDPVTCTATADSNGNWSCTLPSDLPPGTHTVQVVITDTGNNVTTLGPYTVIVASSPATVSGNINAPDTGAGAIIDMPFVRFLIIIICVGILGSLGYRLGRR